MTKYIIYDMFFPANLLASNTEKIKPTQQQKQHNNTTRANPNIQGAPIKKQSIRKKSLSQLV